MTEMIFKYASTLALLGWVILIAGLFIKTLHNQALLAARFIIPLLLGVVYIYLIVTGGDGFKTDSFSSLSGIKALFSHDQALLAGWVHYLAFDLFVGAWIVEDQRSKSIPALVVLPCLLLTFLFGPAGYVSYGCVRFFAKKKGV